MNVSLKTNPAPAQWLEFDGDTVILKSGKVEIGQGIGIALMQIAADALGIDLSRLRLLAGDTAATPNELWTSASISVEVGGSAVRTVCTETRRRFTKAAEAALGTAVVLRDGRFFSTTRNASLAYGDLADRVDMLTPVPDSLEATANVERVFVGRALRREDLTAKLTGAGFVHDIDRPGMVHGRVVLPPRPGVQLAEFDSASVESMPGVIAVVRDGSFLGIAAEREEQAIAAQERAETLAVWRGDALPESEPVGALLDRFAADPAPVVEDETGQPSILLTFTRPFLAHASVGLCCAVAEFNDAGLTVWSHSQGVFPLRDALARALRLSPDSVTVKHASGAGCYGHNGADDVALDAALVARTVGRPVRMMWTRAQELAAAPAGPAMSVELSAGLDAAGRIDTWHHRIKGFTHLTRPGWGDGVNLQSAWAMAEPMAPSPTADPGQIPFGGAGCRNGPPLYDVPARVDYALIEARPLRTSALRALGAHLNVFAIESMMDELAAEAGRDAVDFRLDHLADTRARRVIVRVAEMAGWPPAPGNGSSGTGLGFARYKNSAAYCAVIVELALDHRVRARRVWAAVDAGLAINPDGVINQIEGGILQSLSWTLKEELRWTQDGFSARNWDDYPILAFDEVPEITVELTGDPSQPPLGIGECATGPTAAAVGNALKQGLGVRLTDMPLSLDRITSALM